jgi:hypothetical protein
MEHHGSHRLEFGGCRELGSDVGEVGDVVIPAGTLLQHSHISEQEMREDVGINCLDEETYLLDLMLEQWLEYTTDIGFSSAAYATNSIEEARSRGSPNSSDARVSWHLSKSRETQTPTSMAYHDPSEGMGSSPWMAMSELESNPDNLTEVCGEWSKNRGGLRQVRRKRYFSRVFF